jgi:hypothetical protein
MSDLLQQSRRRTKQAALACGGAVLAGAAWALMPPRTPVIEAPSAQLAAQDDAPIKPAPLDVKAFDTPVWTMAAAPLPPPPPAPPPPPPPPLKLQLIGILKEEQDYKAVLYDPDTNKLFVVATGQEAQGHRIDRVAADAITIKDGAVVRTLALKTGGAGGGP